MASLSEIKALALQLSVSERSMLASDLLHSLPPEIEDDDEEYAETLRRRAEMEADPSMYITLDELMRAVGR